MSEPGTQTISIYILPNISSRKDNQTMKFGQLIEYIMRNVFLQESGGETNPGLFFKKSTLSIFSSNINEVIRGVSNFFFIIRFYTHKKHKKNTRYQKVPKGSFKLCIFFHDKILHPQKAQKEYKAPKSIKRHKNATKRKHKAQINK